MPPLKLTISEIGQLLNVSPKMIRHYHKLGVLPEPARADNGYRLYTSQDLHQIQKIRELQAYGLSLKQIKVILESDEPHIHLDAFLRQRNQELGKEIFRLQQQQASIQAFLQGDIPQTLVPLTSSRQILHDVIKPFSNSLADVLVEVEAQALHTVDQLPHTDAYVLFWEQVATLFAKSARPYEHQFVLWLERYLALSAMMPDDRQGQAWLHELKVSSTATLLGNALDFPHSTLLPKQEQVQIQQLILMQLFEQANPLQKAFLALLKPMQ